MFLPYYFKILGRRKPLRTILKSDKIFDFRTLEETVDFLKKHIDVL